MTQSVPSRIALATSVASARVGCRLRVIDSSICVAVMTGFPARTAFRMRLFWTTAICSIGVSTPRSPRDHETVGGGENLVQAIERPGPFDLGDHEGPVTEVASRPTHALHVGGRL